MGAFLSRGDTVPTTTVIIPTFNEATHIAATVRTVRSRAAHRVEVLVADGYSTDGTAHESRRAGARVVRARGGRGRQINAAVARSRGRNVAVLHADTAVPQGFDAEVARLLRRRRVAGGAFALRIGADDDWRLRVVEAVANRWRSRFLQTPYGDQMLFMRRETLDAVGGYPVTPFLDDYQMVRRLARRGKLAISREAVVTSPRRWLAVGVVRTTVLNQIVIAAYHCGVPIERLQSWYRGALRRAVTTRTT